VRQTLYAINRALKIIAGAQESARRGPRKAKIFLRSVTMPCKLCEQRGKTWKGDDPKCAFLADTFSTDNWNCATMHELRTICEDLAVYNEDQYSAVVPVFDCGEFLVLSWYKRLGRIEGAWIIDSGTVLPLTIQEAVVIIEQYRKNNTMERGHMRPTAQGEKAAQA